MSLIGLLCDHHYVVTTQESTLESEGSTEWASIHVCSLAVFNSLVRQAYPSILQKIGEGLVDLVM